METAVCVCQHIKAYFRQCTDNEKADWGEPCADCKHAGTCGFDWLTHLKPLIKETGITIRLRRVGHSDKQGSYPHMGIHQYKYSRTILFYSFLRVFQELELRYRNQGNGGKNENPVKVIDAYSAFPKLTKICAGLILIDLKAIMRRIVRKMKGHNR